jgi:hypothetical protein
MSCEKYHIEVIARHVHDGDDETLPYLIVVCSNPDCCEVILESEDNFYVLDLEDIKKAAKKHLKK